MPVRSFTRERESRPRPLLVIAVALALVALLATSCSSGGGDDESGDGNDEAADLEVRGEGDTYEATIKRTNLSVPHITGDSFADISFGQGYANAEDHFCTVADQVVKVRSERSAFHGPGEDDANLNSDLAYLAIGLYERAEAGFAEQSDDVQSIYEGFAAGFNAFLDQRGPQDVSGWCAGEPWVRPIDAVDVYAYGKSLMLLASGGQLLDYTATATPPGAPADVVVPVAGDSPGGDDQEGDAGDDTSDDDGGEPDSTTTTAPDDTTTTTGSDDTTTTTEDEEALAIVDPASMASNGWAIGAERSAEGGGMLLANPHFPWEGELRFWESHLIIPGEYNVYGAQLLGLPGIGVGFNEHVGWTHTVSAGNRFTAYTLDLVPGSPTSYLYDGEPVEMEATDHTVQVRQDDGRLVAVTRTLYSSQYGPIINFPGVGWTDAQTITYRDANIDNDVFSEQYLAMGRAESLEDFIDSQREITGVPLFNTVAVSAEGEAWYADTSATPNLSAEAIAAYEASLESDPLAAAAADSGAVLLDGSTSLNEWVEVEGARSPGLVPFDDMPQLTRDDYVFNANDSYWLANDEELIEGDFTPLMGEQDTPRSPRTRQNATVLADTSEEGAAGDDGKFTFDEVKAAVLANEGYTAVALRDEVVARCQGATTVDVPALANDDGSEALPAASIDVADACRILEEWDGLDNLDSVGAHIWREFMSQYPSDALYDAGELWADPFEADDPVGTPSGLAPAPDGGDPVLVNLARAVQIIEAAGWPLDAPLGDIQYADRAGTRVPIHGGSFFDGVLNVVGFSPRTSSTEPGIDGGSPLAPTSALTTEGYPVNSGTSFLMVLEYTENNPKAGVILTYSETGNPERPVFERATEKFSKKEWRPAIFTEKALAKEKATEEFVVRG
jgi:acyl-homoserine-lactone acylase